MLITLAKTKFSKSLTLYLNSKKQGVVQLNDINLHLLIANFFSNLIYLYLYALWPNNCLFLVWHEQTLAGEIIMIMEKF